MAAALKKTKVSKNEELEVEEWALTYSGVSFGGREYPTFKATNNKVLFGLGFVM
jgi:hypothetical protein